jgi:hypothetical protein
MPAHYSVSKDNRGSLHAKHHLAPIGAIGRVMSVIDVVPLRLFSLFPLLPAANVTLWQCRLNVRHFATLDIDNIGATWTIHPGRIFHAPCHCMNRLCSTTMTFARPCALEQHV